MDEMQQQEDVSSRRMPSPQSRELQVAIEHIAWVAQLVHQAHHDEDAGAWVECKASVCVRTRVVLEELGVMYE